LVADDEVDLGRAIRAELGDEHDVVCARSGREALELLRRHRHFDLVVCDLLMPDVTGMEVYEAVQREAPELAGRFVFITGGAFTGRARAFLDTVDRPVLEKPFDVAALRELLEERLVAER
jgi:CheY-like chemotaxis protein